MNVLRLSLSAIDASSRIRPIDRGVVEILAEDIRQSGLMQPIAVRPVRESDGLSPGITHVLIAGLHRLWAVTSLGWDDISAAVHDVTPDQATIMEIDENIIRAPFKPLDFAKAMFLRKVTYEAAYPQTKNGAKGLLAISKGAYDGRKDVRDQDLMDGTFPERPASRSGGVVNFTEDAADRLGLSRRQVQKYLSLYKKINWKAAELLGEHPVTHVLAQMITLSDESDYRQMQLAALVVEADCKTIKEALLKLDGAPAKDIAEGYYNKASLGYLQADQKTRIRMIEFIRKSGLPQGYRIVKDGEV